MMMTGSALPAILNVEKELGDANKASGKSNRLEDALKSNTTTLGYQASEESNTNSITTSKLNPSIPKVGEES